jgi:hypothetical protein
MLNVVHCPACSLKLHVPEDLLRKRVMCPTCGQTFEADSWVMEPEELVTSSAGSPARPTEEFKGAAPQQSTTPPRKESLEPPPAAHFEQTAGPGDWGRQGAAEPPWVRPVQTRPAKVEAMAVMMLVGGIVALSFGLGGLRLFHFANPVSVYSIVLGAMAIIRGTQLFGRHGHVQRSPKAIAVMQVINIVNGDVPNLIMGIISLSFLKDPAVRRYFRC